MNLSLEFGQHWRQSIAERLRCKYPALSGADAEHLDAFAAKNRDWAHGLIASCMLDGTPIEADARQQIMSACPWLDAEAMERLWNQGCYYAMKQ
jgi:hypothetical protein